MDPATTSAEPELAPPTLPDQVATFRHLDPAAALAFRTPLQEHPPAADTKAAAILTAMGIMLTLLARYGTHLTAMLTGRGFEKFLLVGPAPGVRRAGPGGDHPGVPDDLAAIPGGPAEPGILRRHRPALSRGVRRRGSARSRTRRPWSRS